MPSARGQDLGEFFDFVSISGGKNEGLHGNMVMKCTEGDLEKPAMSLKIVDLDAGAKKMA